LALLGIVRRSSETHTEFSGRAGDALPERRPDLDVLAELSDLVVYSPEHVADADAARADSAAVAIAETVHERVPRRAVWLRRLDPRQLRSGGRRPRQEARSSRI
jgi:hypothetical protein